MYRSKQRNKFLKTRTKISRKAYVKYRNHCVSLFREEKLAFYNNLNLITDNKNYGNRLNLFSRTNSINNNMLIENNKIVSDKQLSEVMNTFFSDVINRVRYRLRLTHGTL